jgi:preprotein translocase subunit SecD
MNLLRLRFNYYLFAVLLLTAAGCASGPDRKSRKEESVVQLFMEAEADIGDQTAVIQVVRSVPVPVRIYKRPFLDSSELVDAAVVDVVGGFVVQLQFTAHGALVLEQVSTAHRGSRIAVFGIFPGGRWLAAPVVANRITNGVFVFTPDATREEAERLVRGLNNVAIRLGNKPKPGKTKGTRE